jgi:opacity protein-like surface antigen
VPFAEAAIGFAMVDTGVDDSTDLTWEVGGGAAYFISEATSIDASLRWYQTDTDGGDTEGIRLFIGMTTRF